MSSPVFAGHVPISVTRYLLENIDWLEEELGGFDDDYLIIDCPGSFLFASYKSRRAHASQAKLNCTPITHSSPLSPATCSGWAYGPAPCTFSSLNSWKTATSFSGPSFATLLARSDLLYQRRPLRHVCHGQPRGPMDKHHVENGSRLVIPFLGYHSTAERRTDTSRHCTVSRSRSTLARECTRWTR